MDEDGYDGMEDAMEAVRLTGEGGEGRVCACPCWNVEPATTRAAKINAGDGAEGRAPVNPGECVRFEYALAVLRGR
jgi:hypothetical protein